MKLAGAVAKVRHRGLSMVVENAVQLPVFEGAIDPSFAKYNDKSYRTCRNAQFAWAYSKGLYLPDKVYENHLNIG